MKYCYLMIITDDRVIYFPILVLKCYFIVIKMMMLLTSETSITSGFEFNFNFHFIRGIRGEFVIF